MGKDKKNEKLDTAENIEETPLPADPDASEDVSGETVTEDAKAAEDAGLEELRKSLESKTKQCDEYFGMLQRTAAEFDNYKKRTAREKEAIYQDSVCDVIASVLPIADSIERALKVCREAGDKGITEGIELVVRQLKDVFKKLEVEEIKSVGEEFDPELHNAVMHVEDDSYGQNTIVEEFQKGYKVRDRVVRHSMVKVAN